MEKKEFFIGDEKEYKCSLCKDTGKILEYGKPKKCPNCGGIIKPILNEDSIEKRINEVIPEEYRDIIFNADILRNDPNIEPFIRKDPLFSFYVDMISEIYNKINVGEKLKRSLFISAPQGLGKKHFVYGCINAAIRNGMTAAPYLDCKEIYEMIRKGEDLTDIIESDICFMKIPTGIVSLHDTQTAKLITDRRARRALPTIVISRFPLNFIYSIEINLDRFIVSKDYEQNSCDYSRLRVIQAPQPDIKSYVERYQKKYKR